MILSALIFLLGFWALGLVLATLLGSPSFPLRLSLAVAAAMLPEFTGLYALQEEVLGGNSPGLIRLVSGAGFLVGMGMNLRQLLRRESRFSRHDLHLARRFTFQGQRSVSALMVRLGVISIALGVAVMEIAISVVSGFQHEIQQKVIGFGSHLRIGYLLEEQESSVRPMDATLPFLSTLRAMPEVESIAPFITHAAMLKSARAKEQEGVILRGTGPDYPDTFLKAAMKEGRLPAVGDTEASKDILISRKLSQRINAGVGDKVFAYFFEEELKFRDFRICGIYETGLEEFDNVRVFCDIRVLQRLRRWEPGQAEAYELWLKGTPSTDEIYLAQRNVEAELPYDFQAMPIQEQYAELFEWVELQHQNVWVILIIMAAVAVINMSSVILVMILERTRTIGLLKAMGMPSGRVTGIFVANAFFLILMGLVLGNVLGLGILLAQDLWGFLKVDQANYFVSTVPVAWAWDAFIWVNLGVMAVCTLFMYLPAQLIAGIRPVRALRYD